jgi:C4-type Zn-finger protein
MKELLLQIGEMRSGDKKFTLILTDPLAQSFLQNPYLPEEDKNAKR